MRRGILVFRIVELALNRWYVHVVEHQLGKVIFHIILLFYRHIVSSSEPVSRMRGNNWGRQIHIIYNIIVAQLTLVFSNWVGKHHSIKNIGYNRCRSIHRIVIQNFGAKPVLESRCERVVGRDIQFTKDTVDVSVD